MAMEFQQLRELFQLTAQDTLWAPPPHGMVKVNFNASWKKDQAGAAIIIKDHSGPFLYTETNLSMTQ